MSYGSYGIENKPYSTTPEAALKEASPEKSPEELIYLYEKGIIEAEEELAAEEEVAAEKRSAMEQKIKDEEARISEGNLTPEEELAIRKELQKEKDVVDRDEIEVPTALINSIERLRALQAIEYQNAPSLAAARKILYGEVTPETITSTPQPEPAKSSVA